MSKGGDLAAGCVVALVMVPVGIILRGFVLCQLWLWFLMPLGVKEIGMAHALGLTTLVSMFGMQSGSTVKKDDDTPLALHVVVMTVAPPLFCLFAGWLFHNFM
jgi:hypothetical protein